MKSFNIIRRLATVSLIVAVLATCSSLAVAQSGTHGANSGVQKSMDKGMAAQKKAMQQIELGLEGYCPVCIVKQGKWVKGVAEHSATFDGVTYYFPSAEVLGMFQKDPIAFVPVLRGDCTVCYVNAGGKRSPGSIRFAALNNERLYLFPNDALRQEFNKTPAKFSDIDLAADGKCIVCKVKSGKIVDGSTEFTSVHDGFRYLFPSDELRKVFAASPAEFINADSKMMTETMMKKESSMKGESKEMMKSTSMIQIQGKTACAACEFGVTPINAPEELGLAVTTPEGQIYVIEESHTRWPKLYKDRYAGLRVAVSGNVIKTKGNITWINPSAIETR